MIEKLMESHEPAFGFKVVGRLTPEDVSALSHLIETAIASYRKPIGVLVDLSEMHGASWSARWDEMRFLQRHSDHVASMAVVCNDESQEISEMILAAAAFMQAETAYFNPSDIHHAWHWVKMNQMDEGPRIRIIHPGKGLFQDYTPEYVGL